MIKKTALLAAALLLSATATACADEDSGGTDDGKGGKHPDSIAFFGFAKANSFTAATYDGVKRQAGKEGAEAHFFDAGFDARKQTQQLQDAITSKRYDVFIVQAVDGAAVVPAVRSAVRKGIAVVVHFTPVGTRYDTAAPQVPGAVSLVDVPAKNGRRLGELGVGACKAAKARPCEVAYLEGMKTLPLDNARTKAVVAALEAAPGVRVVARVEGGYTRETGRKAAQDVLQAHPGVDVIIGSSQAVLGAEKVAKGKKIAYVGNGASRQAVAAVREGRWYGIPYLPVTSGGAKAAELGLAKARGDEVDDAVDLAGLVRHEGVFTKKEIDSLHITGEYDD